MKIKIKKLTTTANIPTRGDSGAAGLDLYADDDYVIFPGERKLISTGIAMAITPGFYGHICDRSGMAYKNGGHVLAGILDESYRGEIKVVLLNTDESRKIEIKRGDRIAQLIIKRYYAPKFIEMDSLDETDRGTGGFGSTGK